MKDLKLFVIALLCIGIGISFVSAATALQPAWSQLDHGEKQIIRPNGGTEPVELVDLKADGEKLSVGRKFDREGDWLRDLTVTYRNTTKRNIVSMSVLVTFPETQTSGSGATWSLSFGVPRAAAMSGDRSIVAKPGDLMPVTLPEKDFDRMRSYLQGRNNSLPTLSKVGVQVTFIIFDDGTAWGGQYEIRDPQHPNHWIPDPKAEKQR